ncbi:putative btb poz domain-containing protein [Diplodia seriata]|uniref:Putative btb poz domain-containing protein n=1 Tax=Diplodia seriata TaxID=420778 RepID=A0A0G2DSD1_9PEZI|nr:putative btb poz domain-containing protein [Diplodia seriata]
MSEYFDNGLYSDLRIKDSNGHEYAVHRVVVCGQSPVLANAVKPEHGFKTGVINLEDDDPDAVKAMLQFMYRGSYTITEDDNAMTQVARAYALGEMYCVPELKEAAAAKFKELSSAHWERADFVNAVRVIYDSVPDTDKGSIREIVVEVVAKNYSALLAKPEFEAVLDDFSALGKNGLRALSRNIANAPKEREYKCYCSGRNNPPHTVRLTIDHYQVNTQTACPDCGTFLDHPVWAYWEIK